VLDTLQPFTFCCTQAQAGYEPDFYSHAHLPSPARRGSRSRTASPPAPLAIRKALSASVESIQPRPPRPCEVGRPKGRRRKNRRQSHNFFKHLLRLTSQPLTWPLPISALRVVLHFGLEQPLWGSQWRSSSAV